MTILYTAPTTIRTFMKWGEELPAAHDLSSRCACSDRSVSRSTPRRGCGTASVIGGDRCPIVDTWWQTETGAIMITPLPGVTATKPGAAMRPFPGIGADVVDERGRVGAGRRRRLPRPHRAVAVDAARHLGRRRALPRDVLVAVRRACYFAGDGAKKDDDGDLWLLGRVDDVMNVSGHRISTTEVESALVVAPVGRRGGRRRGVRLARPVRAIVAFVTPKGSVADDERPATRSSRSCATTSRRRSGQIAKPRQILITPELPKTRSGKIMRRLLRDVAENRELGDVTTLADPSVTEALRARIDASGGDDDKAG